MRSNQDTLGRAIATAAQTLNSHLQQATEDAKKHVLVLDRGVVVWQGLARDLLAQPPLLERHLGVGPTAGP